jgi:hypothetical protein
MPSTSSPSANIPKEPCFRQPPQNSCDLALCRAADGNRFDIAQASNKVRRFRASTLLWIDGTKLVDAADAGCSTCQFIYQRIEAFEKWTYVIDRELVKKVEVWVTHRGDALYFDFSWSMQNANITSIIECRQKSRFVEHLTDLKRHHEFNPWVSC